METTVEPLEGNRVKLTVTSPAAEVDKAIAGAYTRLGREVRVPGFRKGHTPRPVLENFLGRDRVLGAALEDLVEETYPLAVDAERLRPIDQPDMGTLDGLEEHTEYTYAAEVDVRPEYVLEPFKQLKVSAPAGAATDQEIDAEIEQMRERFSSLEVVEDRGIGDGDFALISFVGLVDGAAYEGNTVDKYLYELGRGVMPKDFDDALIGAKTGDTVQANFTIPETTSNPTFAGKEATFDITVHEVKTKVLPPLDADFAGNAGGFDSMDEVRADIRSKMDESKTFGREREIQRRARRALAEHLEGEGPEAMVIGRRDEMIRDFFNNLQARGISLKEYVTQAGVDPEQIQKDIEEEARARVNQELALEALFRREGMEVTDEDVEAELADMAEASGKTAEDFRHLWEQAGVLAVLQEQVMQRKAMDWLLEHTEVVDEEPETPAEEPKKKSRVRANKKEAE